MNNPEYRQKVWPICSGMTEAGMEIILALRAFWLSQDDRWNRYWSTRAPYSKAA